MDGAKHAGGRPRSASPSATPEVAELAKFLWDMLDESGTSVGTAQRRLTPEHFPGVHQQIPSVSTLYKRLSGEGLAGAGRLVDALVEVCTPPERRTAVQRKADELKAAVRAPRSQVNTMSPSDDCRVHLTQLTQAQQRIILMQDEISRLKDGRQDSEKESPEWRRLREDLERAEAGRGHLESELAAAQREIRTLREQLLPVTVAAQPKVDPELDRVETELRRVDPDGRRFGVVLRRAFDIVYDGGRTGRFRPDQLSKVEKAQLLTLVVSELYREFGINEGQELDFRFDGVDVACVFSSSGAWMLPPEAASRLCLLVSADDSRSSFSVGLLRATPDALNAARNRDGKSTVSATGRRSIRYLVRDGALPENVLLHTSSDDVAVILAKGTSSRDRVFELFRRVRNRTVNRATLGAVTMQEDAAKRVRDARRSLAAEGLVVLGHATPRTCAALGLSLPDRGEYVSVRVARRRPHHGDAPHVDIGGDSWVLATPEDPVEQAPVIPTRSA